MISFIWSLRGQRLGTTVKHESLFPWGSIAVAVTTALLSTLDGNNIILTPRSLDHRRKNPPPPSVRSGKGWFFWAPYPVWTQEKILSYHQKWEGNFLIILLAGFSLCWEKDIAHYCSHKIEKQHFFEREAILLCISNLYNILCTINTTYINKM